MPDWMGPSAVWSLVNSLVMLAIATAVGFLITRKRDVKIAAAAAALRLAEEERARAIKLVEEERARARELAAAQTLLMARVVDAEKEIAVFRATMTTALLPVSAMFQAALVNHLTHNHTPEMDDLLARINELAPPEEQRLFVLLQERVVEFDDPEIDDLERDAAVMMPYVMRRVKAEAAVAAAAAVPQVTIAAAAATPKVAMHIESITGGKPEGEP